MSYPGPGPALRAAALAVPLVTAMALLAACSTPDSKTSAGDQQGVVTIAFTDEGCTPQPATVPAGALTFKVSNNGASRVTEAEVLQNGRILGEKENLTPGLSGSFSLRLTAGDYMVNCPNATNDQAPLTITAATNATPAQTEVSLTMAVHYYQEYVINQVANLVPATATFVAAVKAGNIEKAKPLYAPARSYYEKIEPVAESFGNLDPDIDARVNDVADPTKWTGFHRIEKALWQDKSLAGMGPYADKLLADVKRLQTLVASVKLQPAQVANGAVDLLGEVANSKITGEEDRYSHTDLWDFEANIAGAREAFEVLEPAVRAKNPTLADTITARFAAVLSALSKYQTSNGYVDYSTVGQTGRRELTTVVDALAEPLSQVAPTVV